MAVAEADVGMFGYVVLYGVPMVGFIAYLFAPIGPGKNPAWIPNSLAVCVPV
jgi:hypothetical protein